MVLGKESCLPFLFKKKSFLLDLSHMFIIDSKSFFSWDSIPKFHPLLCRFIPNLLFIINIYFDDNEKSHCT